MADSDTSKSKVFCSTLSQMGWYSSDKDVLKSQFETFMKNVVPKNIENIKAIILPHAGYQYSGQVAAFGIKEIQNNKYDRIIIMGPSHYMHMMNYASVPDSDYFETPLGKIPIDKEFINKLLKHPSYFKNIEEAQEEEHSVQIEMPLLQYAYGIFKCVPIVVGEVDYASAQNIAKVILSLIDESTLIVVSSDFTHFGSRFGFKPFNSNIKENIKNIDFKAFKYIEALDQKGFMDYCHESSITICGKNPISILLAMLNKDFKVTLLKYSTSGELTGDYNNCVSYISCVFSGNFQSAVKNTNEEVLTESDRKELLKLVRKTLEFYFTKNKTPNVSDLDIQVTLAMETIMGAFVTLHKHGDLRGCIGEIVPRRALYKACIDHAINSAVNDYRFSGVTLNELKEIEFEISALTAPKPVASYDEIVLGKHGIVLEKNGRSAVFLPQVAPEQHWDLATTLTHLAMKAGLAPDAWKENCSFEVFEAIVFSENDK